MANLTIDSWLEGVETVPMQPDEIRPQERAPSAASFLPDLCGVTALFAVVIIGELVAIIITVADTGFGAGFFHEVGLLSIYVQWLGMSAAAVLCMSRKILNRFGEQQAPILSYLLVVGVTYAVCEVAWWVVTPVDDAGAIIPLSHNDLLLRTMVVSSIVAALVLRYFYVQFHWKQRIASEALARLEALQARIRPHFFFNCMNSIASLTRSDPDRAERAIEDLADLFRASLADAKGPVPLTEEIAFVERYLSIEQLRLGDRLSVDWQVEDLPPQVVVPLLSLQPLVENAIYHGIEPALDGGTVTISAHRLNGKVELVVCNPVSDASPSRHEGNRIAIENVRQRLAAHFGAAADLQITHDEQQYVVRFSVPVPP